MEVECPNCRATLSFDQPYRYHAGHGDQGFLYDDSGTLTLVWSSYDKAYEALVGDVNPWALTEGQRAELESRLLPAPNGKRWRFGNPPRCTSCGEPIGKAMPEDMSYLIYPGSIVIEADDGNGLAALLEEAG